MMSWRGETPPMPWSYSKRELGRRHQKVQFARRQENNCGDKQMAFTSHVTCPTEGLLNKA